MELPVRDIREPAILAGHDNGELPGSLLHGVKMPGGSSDAFLVEPAARAMRAMIDHAARDGILLCSTSSYRTRSEQDRLFRDRFRTFDTGRRPAVTRTFDGKTWWLLPGVALAAVPGRSNHGKGLADDLSEQRDGDPEPESISDDAVAWLVAHELDYGYSHEVPSEPWHVRYWSGDDIPAAVHAHEKQEEDMARLVRHKDGKAVYVSTYTVCRWVQTGAELETLLAAGLGPVTVVDDLTPYGVLIGPAFADDTPQPHRLAAPTTDVAALAAELAPLLTPGTVPPQAHPAGIGVATPTH